MIMIQQKMALNTGIRKDTFSVISKKDGKFKAKRQPEAAPRGGAKQGNISISAFCAKLNASGMNIGRNRMFKWLRENGYITRQKSTWNMPHQKYVREGLLAVKETFVLIADEQVPRYSPLITPKGRKYFTDKLAQTSTETKKKKTV